MLSPRSDLAEFSHDTLRAGQHPTCRVDSSASAYWSGGSLHSRKAFMPSNITVDDTSPDIVYTGALC